MDELKEPLISSSSSLNEQVKVSLSKTLQMVRTVPYAEACCHQSVKVCVIRANKGQQQLGCLTRLVNQKRKQTFGSKTDKGHCTKLITYWAMGVCVYAANQHLHSLYTDSEETRHIPLLYLQTNR